MTNEEAIGILKFIKDINEVDPEMIDEDDVTALNMAITEMLAKRPHGKWIFDYLGYLICSNCGYECLYNEEGCYSLGCYCHHCGADMREADNEKANL